MKPIVIDVETIEILEDGSQIASLDAYKPNFRISSMAATELGENGEMLSYYFVGEAESLLFLKTLGNRPIICHNIQYDAMVVRCRFPDLKLNWAIDTMRLAQQFDNGGDDEDFEIVTEDDSLDGEPGKKQWKPLAGFSLVKCLKRILKDNYIDHKKEAYDWIKANTKAKEGQEGKYLHLLPSAVMERYNCFSGNTKFITNTGLRRFDEFKKGDSVTVLTLKGWLPAKIVKFENRPLIELILRKGKQTKSILTTPDHRWIIEENKKHSTKSGIITTENLKKEMRIKEAYSEFFLPKNNIGIAHGIVFGDGTFVKQSGLCKVKLINDKRELLPYITQGTLLNKRYTNGNDKHYWNSEIVDQLPHNWKSLPNLLDRDYAINFFKGWFSVDGSVSKKGELRLSSVNKEAIDWVINLCYLYGIKIKSYTQEIVKSGYKPGIICYVINFSNELEIRSLLIRTKHKNNLRTKHMNLYWKVEEVRSTSKIESVWCVSEPETHTFTLEHNILTKNCGDTENTMELYVYITNYFKNVDFDWTFDHALFLNSVHLIIDSKIRGIKVNRIRLFNFLTVTNKKIEEIARDFRAMFIDQIRVIERERMIKYIREVKTPKARHERLIKALHNKTKYREVMEFNVGSNKQLERLFVDLLKFPVKFKAPKEGPSFKSSALVQFGEGGEVLKQRRKYLLLQKQSEALLELSKDDGRWHADLKLVAAATGRAGGGSHG